MRAHPTHGAATTATARRILTRLRHDPRTVVLLVAKPSVLMVLLRHVLDGGQRSNATAPALLGVFPFTVTFLLTSVTTLRERTTGTLERLMTMPVGKADLLLGHAVALGAVAVAQVAVATGGCLVFLDIAGPVWALLPITPRADVNWLLGGLSDVLPLSHAVNALTEITTHPTVDSALVRDVVVIAGSAAAALALGAATLRRRTA